VYATTRHRAANSNRRTQLEQMINRAGVKSWPKPFHNPRSTRATEVAAEYPAHVAAARLGHLTTAASKHDWQVTDEGFAKAVSGSCPQGNGKSTRISAQQPPLRTER